MSARPVLFVTNYAPPARIGAFKLLAEAENVEFALFGGSYRHGGPQLSSVAELPFPVREIRQRDAYGLARSGRYRAVVCGTNGRVALPAAYLGARRARVPFVLWATVWAHPRTPAHLLSYLPLRAIYRSASAVVTYGPHISEVARRMGARKVSVAPQAVDNDFWGAHVARHRSENFQALYVGRLEREKGIAELAQAWDQSQLAQRGGRLVVIGDGSCRDLLARHEGVSLEGSFSPERLRDFYAASDALVLPSIETADFREPWGLVCNEAMNQGLPVIATNAVGAAAGGLIRNGETGIVVPAGDLAALAQALTETAADGQLRERMGAEAKVAVSAYTQQAWADGFSATLANVSVDHRE